MTNPICQTCGARAEWVEAYQQEIAHLKMLLAVESRKRSEAERTQEPARIPVAHTPSPPQSVTIRTGPSSGPKIIESWTVRAEVEAAPAHSSSMARAFRNALGR
ncbi:MAG: hypothetical protein IT175_06075 [Acidobacteria bacterium]|nr:hypothetical protein [Acidobacteriota bacterium]